MLHYLFLITAFSYTFSNLKFESVLKYLSSVENITLKHNILVCCINLYILPQNLGKMKLDMIKQLSNLND